jgi:hypothetical protein
MASNGCAIRDKDSGHAISHGCEDPIKGSASTQGRVILVRTRQSYDLRAADRIAWGWIELSPVLQIPMATMEEYFFIDSANTATQK